MVLIWRGWGILAPAIGLVSIFVGLAVGTVVPYASGVVLMLGGAAIFLLGHWLNVVRSRGEITKAVGARGEELRQLVQSGRYAMPGAPLPRSYAEAHALAGAEFDAEIPLITKALYNRHTLFWLPMQWFGPAGAAVGVLWLVQEILA